MKGFVEDMEALSVGNLYFMHGLDTAKDYQIVLTRKMQ